MKATPRAAIPSLDQLEPGDRDLVESPRCSSSVLGLQRAPRRRAPRRAHQPREDQLARRLGARQRLGERQQLRERGLALRRDEDRASRAREVGELGARQRAGLLELLLDRRAVAVLRVEQLAAAARP